MASLSNAVDQPECDRHTPVSLHPSLLWPEATFPNGWTLGGHYCAQVGLYVQLTAAQRHPCHVPCARDLVALREKIWSTDESDDEGLGPSSPRAGEGVLDLSSLWENV
jgi:hypothetical protein